MNSENIRIDAQIICGQKMDSAEALLFVVGEMERICFKYPMACPLVKETVTVTSDDMEATLNYRISEIKAVTYNNYKVRTYFVSGNQKITFTDEPGEYVVTYRAVPNAPQTTSDTLPIPDMFAEALKYYLASRIRARLFGQDDNSAASLMEEYNNALREADISTTRRELRTRRMPPSRRGL